MPWDLTRKLLSAPDIQTYCCLWLLKDKGIITLFPPLRFLFDRVHGKAPLLLSVAEEDGDVQAERIRVESGKADFDVVLLQNLTKIYHLPHKRIVAVKNISLGIPAGEVSKLVEAMGKDTGAGPESHQHLLPSPCHCPSVTGMVCSALTSFFLHSACTFYILILGAAVANKGCWWILITHLGEKMGAHGASLWPRGKFMGPLETRSYPRLCNWIVGKLGSTPEYHWTTGHMKGLTVLGRRTAATCEQRGHWTFWQKISPNHNWQWGFSVMQKSSQHCWGLGCHSPSVTRGHGPVHRYCSCTDLRWGMSLGWMPCLWLGPSTQGFSNQLCVNDIKIIVIISTVVIAYATCSCVSLALAIKCGF